VCRYCCTSKWGSTEHQQRINRTSTESQQSINKVSTECQQSVNAFGCCILYNPRELLRHRPIINVLAAVLCKCDSDMVTAPVWKWASTECLHSLNRASTEHQHSVNWVSTECECFWVLHYVYSKGSATAYVHNQHIGSRYVQMRSWHCHSTCLKLSVNRASTIFCVASCIIQGLCYGIYPYSKYRQPL
jgi:hypothetical protein